MERRNDRGKEIMKEECIPEDSKKKNMKDKDFVVNLPQELTHDILARTPAKSVVRLAAVSKGWRDMMATKQFVSDVLSHSVEKPRLQFTSVRRMGPVGRKTTTWQRWFHSVPQEPPELWSQKQNQVEMPSLDIGSATNHIAPPVMGSICRYNSSSVVVGNPRCSKFTELPKVNSSERVQARVACALGFDAKRLEYKVVLMIWNPTGTVPGESHILTLECVFPHFPLSSAICLEGLIFYVARSITGQTCIGTLRPGMVVFAPTLLHGGTLHVLVYDVRRKKLDKVQIDGTFYDGGVDCFLNHVDTPALFI
ncbi:unnamed protein product [Microthlaspi erraticum]|uniref:F-box domain-containing protein n=1 Tax=Microthlaspi erraticum TaxID=1685480 RepID=A0A6D2LAH6_9BRAS|nr:unnamed protein product [Microthlaspi erraticum]